MKINMLMLFRSVPLNTITRGLLVLCGTKRNQAIYTENNDFYTADSLKDGDKGGFCYRAIGKMSGQPYNQIVHEHFAVTGTDDPRYDDSAGLSNGPVWLHSYLLCSWRQYH